MRRRAKGRACRIGRPPRPQRPGAGGDDAHRRPRLPDAPRLAAPGRPPQARAPARPGDRAEEVPRARPRDQLARRLRGARRRAARADHRADAARGDARAAARRPHRARADPARGPRDGRRDARAVPDRAGLAPRACSATSGRCARSSTTTACPDKATVDLCLILDPMLATGGSATAAIEVLKDWGASRIKLVNLIAAPEGVREVTEHPSRRSHPLRGARPPARTSVGYIMPGLGDAGDRQFGTGSS